MAIKEILEIKGYVINLVSLYPRTTSEIRRKLIDKGYQKEDIDQSIRELEKKEYLDDRSYAQKWIKQTLKNRPCGKILCKSQMLKRGLPEDIIDQELEENYSDEREFAVAKKVTQEKIDILSTRKNISQDKLKNKLAFFLKNKGFSTSTIFEIIEEL